MSRQRLHPAPGDSFLYRGFISYPLRIYFDIGRARVTTPDATFEPVRFLFRNHSAAAWAIDLEADSATRVLFATNTTFVRRAIAREDHRLILSDATEWLIHPLPSMGCGACKKGVTKGLGTDVLLDPNRTTIP